MNLIDRHNKLLQETYQTRKYFESIKKPEIGKSLEAAVSRLVIANEEFNKFITERKHEEN